MCKDKIVKMSEYLTLPSLKKLIKQRKNQYFVCILSKLGED